MWMTTGIVALALLVPVAARAADDTPVSIMIFFIDRIEENNSTPGTGRHTEKSKESWVAQQIEEVLVDHDQAFEVLFPAQVEILRKIRKQKGKLNAKDADTLLEIATEQGADYYVVGYAHVIGPEADTRVVPGVTTWVWNAYAKAKMYSTDRGKIVATLDQKGLGGTRNRDAGRIDALRNAGDLIARKIIKKIETGVKKQHGNRTISIKVLSCDFKQYRQIKERVQKLASSGTPRALYKSGVSTIVIKYSGTVDDLAEALIESGFDGFQLEVEESTTDTVSLNIRVD